MTNKLFNTWNILIVTWYNESFDDNNNIKIGARQFHQLNFLPTPQNTFYEVLSKELA
jgi:hypothetical protein